MVLNGMIFQFNSEQGTGLIMLSSGETKEFSTREWVDASHAPAVGLKISYDESEYFKKIKVLDEEENKNSSSDTKIKESTDAADFTSLEEYENHYGGEGFISVDKTQDKLIMQKYSTEGVHSVSVVFTDDKAEVLKDIDPLESVDAHIAYFKDMGFKLAKDVLDGESRDVSLRMYSANEYGEAVIKQHGSTLDITVMMNGKKVFPR